MLRQVMIQGLKVIFPRQIQRPVSLGFSGLCELSGARLLHQTSEWVICGVHIPPRPLAVRSFAIGHRRPPELPASKLESWRLYVAAESARTATTTATSNNVSATKAKKATASAISKAPAPAAGIRPVTSTSSSSKAKESAPNKTSSAARKAPAKTTRPRKPATTSTARAKTKAADSKAKAAAAKARERERAAKAREKKKAAKQREKERKARARTKAKEERMKAKAKMAREKARAKKAARIKKAPSAYTLYLAEHIKSGAAGSKELKVASKVLSQRFKELPPEERRKYEERAAAGKAEVARLREERAKQWAATHSISPYIFFVKENMAGVRAGNPGMPAVDVMKRLAEMWRVLGPEGKQKYVNAAEADRRAKGLKPLSSAAREASGIAGTGAVESRGAVAGQGSLVGAMQGSGVGATQGSGVGATQGTGVGPMQDSRAAKALSSEGAPMEKDKAA